MARPCLLPVAALALAACSSDAVAPGDARQTVTLAVTGTSPALPLPAGAVAASDELVITRAQIVLGEIELKQVAATCDNSGPGNSGATRGCEKIEVGPSLLDVPLDGTVSTLRSAAVPAGSYRELELEIEPPDQDDDAENVLFLAAHPEFAGTSVRAEGTFNGQPFVFTASLLAELELEAPLTVDRDGLNITVRVDLGRWFRDASGGVIDPRTALADVAALAQVRANIVASFDAFVDGDRDGSADDR